MFKEIFKLESILGLSRWALLIFFTVFVLMIIWTWSRPRREVRRWASLPLDDSTPPSPTKPGPR